MSVRLVQNLDKLAIVLSLALITLMVMVQTTFASGAASVSAAAVSGGPLSQATDTGDGGFEIDDASETDDDDFEIADASDTDDGPRGDKPIPPGQLKRRGIFGTIVATGDGFVTIETKFGNVTVNVENSDDFTIGDRFTALLDRSPVPPDASGTTDGSFRTVTALRTKSIPGKATRGHRRSVVVDSSTGTDDEGTLTVLDDDGNPIVLPGGASGTLDGEDTILLIQTLTDGLPPRVLGGITSFSVSKRLERVLATGSPEKLAKLNELIQRRVDRNEARLQRVEARAPAHLKGAVRGARDKNQGKGRGDDGDGGGGPPEGKGKPDDKGNSGGSGGKPDDKGKPDK
ncbi:MAG: hypothetical protein IIC31_06870 [Chloroflexi bacterium]|nr:hypothetical protein [Chloroflexota bacterium]